ncbi:DUF418 domain-containing protein [Corynebacterium sp. H128]|uniref:DUF418 domain-containing protein n=1 Tax=Corynebacterium sp. H128 TaxID=3133427 RepID=UPI0030A73D6B
MNQGLSGAASPMPPVSQPPGQLTAQTRPRILAPDMARGLTLLGIAGANFTMAWSGVENPESAFTLGGVVDGELWDKIAVVFGAMFFHVRGLPMFSTLLGFGVGLISLSLYRRGFPLAKAKRVIVRRYGFLALFGVIHCIFLFWGDIMLAYGLMGMLLSTLIAVKDKTLLIIAGVLAGLNCLYYLALTVLVVVLGNLFPMDQFVASGANTGGTGLLGGSSYLSQLGSGTLAAVLTPLMLAALIPMLGPLMLVGFVAARRGWLTDVQQHRGLLVKAAAVAVAIMVIVGLPLGLAGVGVLPTSWEIPLSIVNNAFGPFTGPGIVAMIALASAPLQRALNDGKKLPEPLLAIKALGQRSMSGYVMQSILGLILVVPYTLGISQGQGAAQATAIGALIWLITVVLAYVLEKLGVPGPFEWLHRRLSYGANGLPAQYSADQIDALSYPKQLPQQPPTH